MMIELASHNGCVREFLSKYPECEWEKCLEAALVFGIQTMNRKYPFGLTLEQLLLAKKVPVDSTLSPQDGPPFPVKQKQHKKRVPCGVAGNSPKYLRHIESKISPQVRRDAAAYKEGLRLSQSEQKLKKVSREENKIAIVTEPKVCSKDTATEYMKRIDPRTKHPARSLLKVVDSFLSNPLTTNISKNSQQLSQLFARKHKPKLK